MADDTPNIVLEYLRRIDRKADTIDERVGRLANRMTALERLMASSFSSDVDQNDEIDRPKRRVDRIERRLELDL